MEDTKEDGVIPFLDTIVKPEADNTEAIYWFQCGEPVCDEEYIGETSRTFEERFKEHLKDPSPVHHHSNTTGYITTQDNFQIIGREDHDIARTIKESVFIRVNNPTLNRNIGKFNLHHIWDWVLLINPGLKNSGCVQRTPPLGICSPPTQHIHAQFHRFHGACLDQTLGSACTYTHAHRTS